MLFGVVILTVTACSENNVGSSVTTTTSLTDVAQTSSQLASGSTFSISGSTSSTTASGGLGGHKPGGRGNGLLDGTELLAPTGQLLAIIDAESAGDFRGLRMNSASGATVTNYDASGATVTLTQPAQNSGGPEGCSFSGKQFPKFDSLLLKIAKTVVDYGTGVTNTHGSTTVTRSGKITITRSGNSAAETEIITFDSYVVNGASISGTKTRVTTFDSTTGKGLSTTNVADGKITFSDGTVTTWTSTKQRSSEIVLDSNNRPVSGQITTDGSTVVATSAGTVIYSHKITKSIIENIACGREHHGPVSGTVDTVYNTDTVSVDFGDGTCSNNTVTVTLNGVVSTKTLQE